MRRVAAAMCIVLTACATLPAPGRPALPDVQFRMRDFKLPNGMRIIAEEEHGSPLAGVFLAVGVGGAQDPVGKEGLAHLIEHLAFRAKADGKHTMWQRIESAGVGEMNAFTAFDETVYYQVGSKDILVKMLQNEAARVMATIAGVDQAVLDVEREVVRNELRQRGENNVGPAFSAIQAAVFPLGHPYARPVVGTHESLSAITLDDAKKFVATYYQPSNMTMLVIGDVDLAKIEDVFAEAFPRSMYQFALPASGFKSRVPEEAPALPEPPSVKMTRMTANVPTPELYVVWSLPRSFGSEQVLQEFVTSAARAELARAWITDPDILTVSVFPIDGLQASMLVAKVALKKAEHPDRSMERILDQLVRIWANGEAGREYAADDARALVEQDRAFGHARNSAVVRMTLDAANILSRGGDRVLATHFSADPLMYGRELTELRAIGPAQVSHFAEKYLRRERARAVLVEPFAADSKDKAVARTGLAGLPEAGQDTAPAIPADAVRSLAKSRGPRPSETIVTAAKTRLSQTLANGLKVIVQQRTGVPVATVRLAFPVGAAAATPRGAANMSEMLGNQRGHRYGSGHDYGIQWERQLSMDTDQLIAEGASGNLPNMLAQLSERVQGVRVEAGELAEFKTDFLEYVEKLEAQPQEQSDRALKQAVFGSHPFGASALAKDLGALSTADITGWADHAWSPQGAVLVVVGDVNPEQTMAHVEQWLGDWVAPKEGIAPLPPPTVRADAAPKVLVTHRPGATQAGLLMACLAEGKSTKLELVNGMLAELLGNHLFETLRGQLGATYGVNGWQRTYVGGTSSLEWAGALENGRLAPALAVLHTALKDFESVALTDTAIGRARWQQAREATVAVLTSTSQTVHFAHGALLGREPEEVDSVFDQLALVSTDELKKNWGQCRGSMVISLVGDEPTIRAALKEAGF